MGQPVLRQRDKSLQKCDLRRTLPKENGVNIPQPGHGDWPFGAQCGNANQLGDTDGRPGKSFLFSLRIPSPWNGFTPR